MVKKKGYVMVEGLTKAKFSNLEKILYPEINVSKKQVLEYYIRIAPRMLEHLEGRLIVMNRYPDGVEKEGFYEKNAPEGTPDWVEIYRTYSESAKRDLDYVVGGDLDTLIWLANLASIEINITLSKKDSIHRPDLVFIDIDPEPPAGMEEAVETAQMLKEKLEKLGYVAYVKTSGKKGLHVVLPILPRYSFKATREFVHLIGRHLSRESEKVVSEFSQGRDPGKVFVDYTLNHRGKTMIAPYSLRATANATVSSPLDWKEVRKGLKSDDYNINTILKKKKNPWGGLLENKQPLEVEKING